MPRMRNEILRNAQIIDIIEQKITKKVKTCSFTCVVYRSEQLYYVTTRPVFVISVVLMEYYYQVKPLNFLKIGFPEIEYVKNFNSFLEKKFL